MRRRLISLGRQHWSMGQYFPEALNRLGTPNLTAGCEISLSAASSRFTLTSCQLLGSGRRLLALHKSLTVFGEMRHGDSVGSTLTKVATILLGADSFWQARLHGICLIAHARPGYSATPVRLRLSSRETCQVCYNESARSSKLKIS